MAGDECSGYKTRMVDAVITLPAEQSTSCSFFCLALTKPPIQWTPGVLDLEVEHSLSSVQRRVTSGTVLFLPDPSGRAVRRGNAAARVLGLRVRIPPVAWMSVCLL